MGETAYKRWMLEPHGKELKKLVKKQRRIEFSQLVEWDGGTNFAWHPEGTHMLLHPHNVLVKRRRRYGRSYGVKVNKISVSKK